MDRESTSSTAFSSFLFFSFFTNRSNSNQWRLTEEKKTQKHMQRISAILAIQGKEKKRTEPRSLPPPNLQPRSFNSNQNT